MIVKKKNCRGPKAPLLFLFARFLKGGDNKLVGKHKTKVIRKKTSSKAAPNVPADLGISTYRDRVEEAKLRGEDVTPWGLQKLHEQKDANRGVFDKELHEHKESSWLWLIVILLLVVGLFSPSAGNFFWGLSVVIVIIFVIVKIFSRGE